ncbi:MAG TPA: hypothetical protein PLP50_12305 [Thermoanaerobaculia bacterium]|nr:hypothetical protein [Thermoanaerobaculia bacterium]HQN08245.1 hypothetical protein [Thermoanaerobaculia bacterium]HQP87389.1 hypothetical protein [Thermoanaerobaculia bacterium]
MITGFNTDIKHGDRVFHVQTEDRGAGNPIVESLVYVGGQILLSKRSPYADLITDGKVDEPAVRQLMDLQHRRIIEAIRRGRFDGAVVGAPETAPVPGGAALSPAAAAAAAAILAGGPASGAIPVASAARPPASAALPKPAAAQPPRSGVISTNAPGAERSLDQVIIEYLAAEAASERLELNLVKGGELVSGEPVALTVRASTSLTDRPVAGAQVTLRIVSSIAPTQVLYRGASGADGLVKVTAALPDIGSGNAALIISATSALGTQEIKQLIRRKAG